MRRPGLTVADLKKKGATPLDDAQLKALIVGKAFWVRNNVTGEQFSAELHGRGPDDRVPRRHGCRPCRAVSATSMRDGYQGTTSAVQDRGRQARHRRLAGSLRGHDLQTRRHLLRRAQQRIRLRQLRDHSAAAVCEQSADRDGQPVLDRTGSDRTTAAADRPDVAKARSKS